MIGTIVLALIALYWRADPTAHLRSFYGNAAADWLGSFVTVVATKFWFERGSPESRIPSVLRGKGPKALHWVRRHRTHRLCAVLDRTARRALSQQASRPKEHR